MSMESNIGGIKPSEEINNVRKEAERLGRDPDQAEREYLANKKAKALWAIEAGEKGRTDLAKFAQKAEAEAGKRDEEQMAA